MPTRTEREALPTFVAKLSRHNPWRKRKTHDAYNALFREKFTLVIGYDSAYGTALKKEWLAAVSWLGYYGKDQAKLETLDEADLHTVARMFKLHHDEISKAVLIEQILALPNFNQPGDNPLADMSVDSSGTDAPPSSKRATKGSGRRKVNADNSRESIRMEASGTSGKKASDKTDRTHEAGLEDSESFSSGSQSDASREARPKKGSSKHHKDPRSSSPSSSEASSSSSSEPEPSKDRSKDRSKATHKKKQATLLVLASDDESCSEEAARARQTARERRRKKQRKTKFSTPEPSPPSTDLSTSDRSESEEEQRAKSSWPRPTKTTSSNKQKSGHKSSHKSSVSTEHDVHKKGKTSKKKHAHKHGKKAKKVQFHHESGSAYSSEGDTDSSEAERDEDLTRTRFQEHNRAEAANIIKACGCALCQAYSKIKTARAKDLFRGARNIFATFRRPSSKNSDSNMREWAAMAFWCIHQSTMSSWESLHERERDYITVCLATPSLWKLDRKRAFARTTVQQLWHDSAKIMAHTSKHNDDGASSMVNRSPTRAAAKSAFLTKINSLIFNPVEWLDMAEQRQLLSQKKMFTAMGGIGQPAESAGSTFYIPYASSPWGQSLVWPATKPMHFVQAGRMISVALRTHSDLFVDQLEVLARRNRNDMDDKLFSSIDKAFKDRNLGNVLVCAAEAKQFAMDILASAHADAQTWERQYDMPEAKEILTGRTRQQLEVNTFFSAVQRSITSGCAAQSTDSEKETFTIGAWGGFFDGMRSGRHNVELTKSTMQRGKKAGSEKERVCISSDKSSSSHSDSDDSEKVSRRKRKREKEKRRRQARATADGSSKSDGKRKAGGSSDGSTRGSGVKCKFKVHFPCSTKIIGPRLGVECSAGGPCRHCKKHGHWSGECPVGWAQAGMTLPGYSDKGRRFKGEWDAEKNPMRDTAKLWTKFLQSNINFPGGGAPALEHGAPSLADYKDWVGKAQK